MSYSSTSRRRAVAAGTAIGGILFTLALLCVLPALAGNPSTSATQEPIKGDPGVAPTMYSPDIDRAEFDLDRFPVRFAHDDAGSAPFSDAQIDAGLAELNLLDPDLDPDQVAQVLSGLLDEPFVPAGGATEAGYELHRRWGFNGLRDDWFAGSNAGFHRARAAARLGNGDVVVVGEILGGGVSDHYNLGIIKYNRRGQRVVWDNADPAFAHNGNQYLRFPGSNAWGAENDVKYVHDVRVHGSNIYALITMTGPGIIGYHPAIIRFRENGSFGGWWYFSPDGNATRDAVAMDVIGDHMVVLGRRTLGTVSTNGGFWTARLAIQPDGGLSLGTITTFLANMRAVPADIAFRRNAIFPPTAAPAYYVAFTRNLGATETSDHDPCVARVLGNDTLDNDWNIAGYYCTPYDNGGNRIDRAVAVHTRMWTTFTPGPGGGVITPHESMYLLTEVERAITNGSGVANFTDGLLDANFGPNGRRIYGGCASINPNVGEGCRTVALFRHSAHLPQAIHSSANPQGVRVVGYRIGGLVQGNEESRPMFMDISATSGALRAINVLGTVPRSRFVDLVPNGSTGEYTLVGWGANDETSTPRHFLSGHVVRKSDLIFYDGLQTP